MTIRRGKWSLQPDKPYAPRLATLASQINAEFPELLARIERGYCDTDRKISGTRLIHPGKGRWGNRLIVTRAATGERVLDHNAAETYRSNDEVVRWIESYRERARTNKKSKKRT